MPSIKLPNFAARGVKLPDGLTPVSQAIVLLLDCINLQHSKGLGFHEHRTLGAALTSLRTAELAGCDAADISDDAHAMFQSALQAATVSAMVTDYINTLYDVFFKEE